MLISLLGSSLYLTDRLALAKVFAWLRIPLEDLPLGSKYRHGVMRSCVPSLINVHVLPAWILAIQVLLLWVPCSEVSSEVKHYESWQRNFDLRYFSTPDGYDLLFEGLHKLLQREQNAHLLEPFRTKDCLNFSSSRIFCLNLHRQTRNIWSIISSVLI